MDTVKIDQLVFRGTREEVDNVDNIDRAWYFAWDTGEFFIGTNTGYKNDKRKYGGISEQAVIELINSAVELNNKKENRMLVCEGDNITSATVEEGTYFITSDSTDGTILDGNIVKVTKSPEYTYKVYSYMEVEDGE